MNSPETPWTITLSDIDLGAEEEAAVTAVLRSRWLTMGPRTADFERQFAGFVGARHAIAVCNGTAALHLALLAAGVGPGDDVIVPSLTFVATANAVLYCGAIPVFGDIVSAGRLHLDPADVARKITAKTKAIVPMHYAGYACDMDAFTTLARRHGLRIVEDAAHAPGATWRGRSIGSIGDATCFSFFANKNLTTGEGGMVTTDDDAIAEAVRRNRSHGMTTASYDRHRGHAFSYDVVSAGHNYRPTEIQSALGLVQLGKLPRNNARRRELTREYGRLLARIDGITLPFGPSSSHGVRPPLLEAASACHILPIVLPAGADRAHVQEVLKAAGIQTSIHYPPVHAFSNFAGRFAADVPVLDAVADRLLTLPLHPLLSMDDVRTVCTALQSSLTSADTPAEAHR